MMLTGRESLVRLVGKRRRFLPNRQFLLSATVQSCLNLCTDKNGRIVSTESVDGGSSSEVGEDGKILGGDMSNSDWVTCPVCCNKVRCGDYAINSHLDVCLSRGTGRGRGTKRKLTQPTLLQLNFCAKSSKLQTNSSDSKPLEVNVIQNCPADSLVHHTNSELPKFDTTVEENDYNGCELPNSKTLTQAALLEVDVIPNCPADSIVQYTPSDLPRFDSTIEEYDNNWCELPNSNLECTSHSTEDPVGDDRISSPETEVPTICNIDDICGVILQTFIVGRRFSDVKEVNLEAIISLQRDPLNVKDPNAIKVLSSDSGCGEVLGFLPRELAQYLSPLIDKFCLSFEGRVSSVPKHSLDVVPIQILCERSMSFVETEHDDIKCFKCLWRNVLHAVDSAKNYPPNMTKYQRNFCLLIQEVLRSNPHLLMDDEKVFLESFTSLSDDSQRLFVRLYTRKGPWFRMSTISYPEVMDSQQAVRGLSAKGYVCTFEYANELHEDDMKGILEMLTVVELRGIWCTFKKNGNRGTRKQDLIASLLLLYEDGLCPLLTSMILDRTGTCIRISPKAESLIWRAERLFFLNGEQDLSAFLLVDLGIVKYPTYNCIISDQIFSDRSELLAYEEAIEVAQIMDQSLEENNVELVLRCIKIAESRMSNSSAEVIGSSSSGSVVNFLFCSSSWIYSKVVLLGVSFIEHERRYTDAIKLLKQLLRCFYCDGRRGLWTLRLSIDLEHMGCLNESLTVAEEGLLDPWVRAGFRMALQRRVLRLGKPPRRWKTPSFSESIKRKITEVHVQGRPLNCEAGMKSRFYGEDGEQCGVEQLALQYYAGEGGGWQGTHTESGIWLTIFGLLMWDIIFSDVPNVFRTKFQTAPLDLETDSFYLTRKSLIESHLQKIHEGMAEEILITSWELHAETACRGVNWDRHSLSELRAAVTCIGGPCLASLCRHLALDYRSWSSGMPDLLLWRFHGEDRGEAKLVEVKGPRDRLSEQQRAWVLILMDSGFNVEVCKVSPLPLSA